MARLLQRSSQCDSKHLLSSKLTFNGQRFTDEANRLKGQAAVRIFNSKPNISKMAADSDVENLAHIVEFGGP
ncbi:MAG: hypothetical protein ACXWET_06230, partial [Halobacteriota archaeon]